jgi:uncharacterized protein with PQ loop repeat
MTNWGHLFDALSLMVSFVGLFAAAIIFFLQNRRGISNRAMSVLNFSFAMWVLTGIILVLTYNTERLPLLKFRTWTFSPGIKPALF